MSTLFNVALLLEGMLRSNAADTTSDHDRLVVSSEISGFGSRLIGKECPESTSQCGAAELVVEASGSNGGLQHDIETGSVTDYEMRSTERSVLLDQVLHVRLVKAKTSLLVMVLEGSQRASFVGKDINHDKRVSGAMSEHGVENGRRKAEEFRHAIMKDVTEGKVLLPLKGILKFDVDDSASFDAVDGLEVTDQRNAGGLGAPWRNISRAHIDIDGLVVAVSGRSGRGLLNGLENLLDTAENGSILGLEIEVVLPGAGKLGNLDRALIVDTLHELLNFRSRVARLADQDVIYGCYAPSNSVLHILGAHPSTYSNARAITIIIAGHF
ncbi:hypothetical protein HG531_010056 [Fusarium graminearum]|nr:hypothetical protein HG531_010056 [Fusarium graminearum]